MNSRHSFPRLITHSVPLAFGSFALSGQSGLSPAVSAGISLGVGIGVLLLMLSRIYAFLLRRHRATGAGREVQPASRIVDLAELGTGTSTKMYERPSDIYLG